MERKLTENKYTGAGKLQGKTQHDKGDDVEEEEEAEDRKMISKIDVTLKRICQKGL